MSLPNNNTELINGQTVYECTAVVVEGGIISVRSFWLYGHVCPVVVWMVGSGFNYVYWHILTYNKYYWCSFDRARILCSGKRLNSYSECILWACASSSLALLWHLSKPRISLSLNSVETSTSRKDLVIYSSIYNKIN